MLRVKIIKPKKFKPEVFRRRFQAAMQAMGKDIRSDFDSTARTWRHKPKFTRELTRSGAGLTLTVATEDEIYTYVSAGTKPHIIRARAAKRLVFASSFTPKTQPGVLGSGPGGASGGAA